MLRLYQLRICTQVFTTFLLLYLLTTNPNGSIVYGDFAEAYLFMAPPTHIAEEIGETFDVAVNISGVQDLCSLEFTITYNASLLDITEVAQGHFFPSPPKSHFEFEHNKALGFVELNMSLADSESPRSGDGTLAWISFKVIQGSESCLSSPINLQQILLLNSALIPISNDSVGALYFWKSMLPDPPVEGRSLDVYTQKGGEGYDMPGGEFMVGETVHLTSRVKYEGSPVQQKLVSFQVRNPLNETVTVRTDVSDQDGLAGISFRIPDVPSSIGVWTAISLVEISEKSTWDTITFRVSPMVVGGHSFSVERYLVEKPLTLYLAITTILAVVSTAIKRKMYKKTK